MSQRKEEPTLTCLSNYNDAWNGKDRAVRRSAGWEAQGSKKEGQGGWEPSLKDGGGTECSRQRNKMNEG